MVIQEALTLVGAVAFSFGGGVAVVVALSSYLGDLWAKRILQRENTQLQRGLEEIKHELGLARSSYEHYLDLILDYYKVFYTHYRLCQRAASADAVREVEGGPIIFTKDEFLEKLSIFLADWAEQEGKIRLLLPNKLLQLHGEAIDCFNGFKRVMEHYQPDEDQRKKKVNAFACVEDVKIQIESGLREFLRTERLLK